jgi:hypothetical protein
MKNRDYEEKTICFKKSIFQKEYTLSMSMEQSNIVTLLRRSHTHRSRYHTHRVFRRMNLRFVVLISRSCLATHKGVRLRCCFL